MKQILSKVINTLLKIFIIINFVVYILIRNFYQSLYNISYNFHSEKTIKIKWKNTESTEYDPRFSTREGERIKVDRQTILIEVKLSWDH